jgi:RNA polymerase sigma-70 factor (ECF subfamily)
LYNQAARNGGYEESPLDGSDALNTFLQGVERRAFRMARLATGDEDEALDIVQDAMFGFVRSYGARPEGEWPPLFYRTLQSRITDWHRRTTVRKRWRFWFGGDPDDASAVDPIQLVPDTTSRDPAGTLLGNETTAAIESALRKLPLRQRQAFLLRAWEGLSVEETATAMGCSGGSVKTHYSRAVHALRGMLGEYEP